jgi:hypothetical protein
MSLFLIASRHALIVAVLAFPTENEHRCSAGHTSKTTGSLNTHIHLLQARNKLGMVITSNAIRIEKISVDVAQLLVHLLHSRSKNEIVNDGSRVAMNATVFCLDNKPFHNTAIVCNIC